MGNGQAEVLGQVALANFRNDEGLTPMGDTAWAESFESGTPTIGSPRTASFEGKTIGGKEKKTKQEKQQNNRKITLGNKTREGHNKLKRPNSNRTNAHEKKTKWQLPE